MHSDFIEKNDLLQLRQLGSQIGKKCNQMQLLFRLILTSSNVTQQFKTDVPTDVMPEFLFDSKAN